MLDSAFSSVYGTSDSIVSSVSTFQFLECCIVSVVCGLIVALCYMFKHDYRKNFVVTLASLPIIVQVVITLVNGNLGAGVAVMGVFNLIRFRSVPGTAKDICSVFFAMAVGLATGMGYIWLGLAFTVIIAVVNVLFVVSPLGNKSVPFKYLKISVPEDIEYDEMFDDALKEHTNQFALEEVATTNMGSVVRLTYKVQLKSNNQKALIDKLRTLNGNLKIAISNASGAANIL